MLVVPNVRWKKRGIGNADAQSPDQVHEAAAAESRALARIEAATLHASGR